MTGKGYVVEMGSWKKVGFPDSAITRGIGSCLGIAILNKDEKIGYLGHFIGYPEEEVEFIADLAIKEAGNPGKLEVIVAGNMPVSLEGEDIWINIEFGNRAEIDYNAWLRRMLRERGIKNLFEYLLVYPVNFSYEMEVDTEKLLVDVREEHYEEN